jgi:CheY-like chemotaxis protein
MRAADGSGMACKDVLVVEDDKDIRETLQQVLELEGYRVTTATNGKEGLESLKGIDRPCVILLDLMMPVMNGWEFLEAHRTDTTLATIPVVVVSAAGDKAKSAPAAGFIKKPVDLESLLNVVRRYCAG